MESIGDYKLDEPLRHCECCGKEECYCTDKMKFTDMCLRCYRDLVVGHHAKCSVTLKNSYPDQCQCDELYEDGEEEEKENMGNRRY